MSLIKTNSQVAKTKVGLQKNQIFFEYVPT